MATHIKPKIKPRDYLRKVAKFIRKHGSISKDDKVIMKKFKVNGKQKEFRMVPYSEAFPANVGATAPDGLPFKLDAMPLFLSELRRAYGRDLKPSKQLEIEDMIRRFAHMAYKKYAAGAKEHKDDLTVEVARRELKGEAIDLMIYLFKAEL